MAETVLVTGGSGYVAGWCITALLAKGFTVRTTLRSLGKEERVRRSVGADGAEGGRLSFAVAELTGDAGWDEAVAGCDYVLHVASPMASDNPNSPDDMIAPARDGALRVLRAAAKAGVKRVVLTSSLAAAYPPTRTTAINDETLWTDPTGKEQNAYRRSKTLAERAAWDHVRDHPSATELVTVLPGAVFGPIQTTDTLGSVMVIGRMLGGQMPRYPNMGLSITDVRDLADIHILAMTSPAAAGQRFIAISDFMWMGEICTELRAKLGDKAAKVPTRQMPDVMLRLMAVVDKSVRNLTPLLGRKNLYTSAKAQSVLGWKPRSPQITVTDCGASLIEHGVV